MSLDYETATENDYIENLIPWVKTVVNRITYVRPVEDTDEYSDALLGLLVAYRNFDTSRNLKFMTYAIHKVRGHVIDGIRNRKEGRRLPHLRMKFVSIERTCFEHPAYHDSGHEDLEQAELIEKVLRCVKKMKKKQRLSVRSIMSDKTQAAYAKKHGLTDPTMRKYVLTGLDQLRAIFCKD